MGRRGITGTLLMTLIAVIVALEAVGISRYRPFFGQPSAMRFVLEPVGILLVYAIAIVGLIKMRGESWDVIRKYATVFGMVSGALEVFNIGLENVAPVFSHRASLSIGVMLTVFSLWGVAGNRAAVASGRVRTGVLAAVSSAGVCMLIAVAAGFLVQFFLAPQDAAEVARWAEFTRSGWTDVRAFALANTLDSGFTHLLIAPVVAAVFGSVGAVLSRVRIGPIVDAQ